MTAKITRAAYAEMFGPTTGDRLRLARRRITAAGAGWCDAFVVVEQPPLAADDIVSGRAVPRSLER